MSEETKVNITLPENWDSSKPLEIIHSEREQIPQRDRRSLAIIGVVGSINEWVGKRTFSALPAGNRDIVVFSVHPDKPFIKFMTDPTDPLGSEFTVSTELKGDPDLHAWGINRDIYFSQKDLKALIRKSAHLFPDLSTVKDLMQRLDNFQAKFETMIEKEDDRQGNKKDLVTQSIKFTKGELPTGIDLFAPIYANTPAVPLRLDIEIEKVNNAPAFAFYCLELQALRVNAAREIVGAEIDKLKDTFVTIEQ